MCSLGFSQTRKQLPVFRIGIVMDGYWEQNEEYLPFFRTEILELTQGEFDVRFPKDKFIEADWTVEVSKTQIFLKRFQRLVKYTFIFVP
jgi:hypothetical protein